MIELLKQYKTIDFGKMRNGHLHRFPSPEHYMATSFAISAFNKRHRTDWKIVWQVPSEKLDCMFLDRRRRDSYKWLRGKKFNLSNACLVAGDRVELAHIVSDLKQKARFAYWHSVEDEPYPEDGYVFNRLNDGPIFIAADNACEYCITFL